MKSTYKRLGDLISPISIKNSDLRTTDLRGVNYQKYFMHSVANTVGVDLSAYKLVEKGQFACNLMHVGRDECLPIALHCEEQPIIVSPAYFTFQVKDENKILSEFLFLWFRRREFDRQACFYTDADVRQGLIKSAFLNMEIPVPSIEEQRKIVAEYQAIKQRIENNRRLIATLEATAQTIYRKMFVDDIDPENLPDGWRMGTIGEFCEINTDNISSKDNFLEIQYLDSSSVTRNIFEEYQTLNTHIDEIPSRAKRKVKKGDIVYSTVRPNLRHYGIMKGDVTNVIVSNAFAVIRSHCNSISNELLYVMLTDDNTTEYLQGIAEMSKATYPSVTPKDISLLKVIIPSNSVGISNINRNIKCCFDFLYYKSQENKELSNLQSLLLAKIGL